MGPSLIRLFILTFIIIFINAQQPECFPPSANSSSNAYTELSGGQQEFSLTLFNEINKYQPKDNLFFSPYSIYRTLLIAYFMAAGKTEADLKKVLKISNLQDKSNIYIAYINNKLKIGLMMAHPSLRYQFTSVNKMYMSNDTKVKVCVDHDFPEEFEQLPFKTNLEGSRQSINNWIYQKTHQMIKDLLSAGSLDDSTNLVLVNAVYFKGVWAKQFNRRLTRSEIFYVSATKKVEVNMMHVEGSFRHDISRNIEADILELPYQGDNISMYVLLPFSSSTEDSAIDRTLMHLDLDNFDQLVGKNSLISKTVHVALPKFNVESTIRLVPILEEMGTGDFFRSSANLTGLIEDGEASLGDAIHKANIEINEENTKAAASTVLLRAKISSTSIPDVQFICNRPFIYFVYDKVENAILFEGIFRIPNNGIIEKKKVPSVSHQAKKEELLSVIDYVKNIILAF